MRNIRHQIIQVLINSTSNIDVRAELDKSYKKATKIVMFVNPIYSSNTNLSISSALTINNEEQFANDFPTGLLFPIKDNDIYTNINAEANGSILEAKVKDTAYTTNYYLTIIVTLENPTNE
jgi:hypothetical protein